MEVDGSRKRSFATNAAVKRAKANVAKYAKGLSVGKAPKVNQELGYFDTNLSAGLCDTTGSVTTINSIANGTSQTQRIGKKITMKSVQIRGHLNNGSAATWNLASVLIVYDRRPGTTQAVLTDIFKTPATSLQLNNDSGAGRFKIVARWDQILSGIPGTTTGTTQSSICFDKFVKLTSARNVVYKAVGTGASGDFEEGELLLCCLGNNTTGTGAASLNCNIRVRFWDT